MDLLGIAARLAGFERRDTISVEGVLRWVRGEGWNKHRAQLRPLWEPVVVLRKPCEGTQEANVARWGTGELQTEACRVGTSKPGGTIQEGRHAPNCVLIHLPWCRPAGTVRVRGDARQGGGTRPGGFGDVGASKGSGTPCAPATARPPSPVRR